MDDRLPLPMTFRVMGPHERGRFAPEAWGHLLSLSGSGAINPLELEHIIERALIQIDGRIALGTCGVFWRAPASRTPAARLTIRPFISDGHRQEKDSR